MKAGQDQRMKYTKTETGQQAFKQRSPSITPRQRSLFILFDGQKTVDQVLAVAGGTQADVESLVDQGYLEPVAGSAKAAAAAAAAEPQARHSDQQRYLEGKALATQITANLGLRGFRLNLSVESAANLQELIDLFPKIQAAAGADHCKELEAALRG